MSDKYVVSMVCDICKNKNYYFKVAKKREKKMILKKFCKNCLKHTSHNELK
jgi:large subunit ribosomal protein L33